MNIYEPKRRAYRKNIKHAITCPFCDSENIRKQGCKNLSTTHWMVMVNKYPYMDGNVMIIPKRHVKDMELLTADEKGEFFTVLEHAKKVLGNIFKTKDFNVGLNIGKLSGASINHMHWQLIPRKEKTLNAANIFADIQVITVSPSALKKMIKNILS